MFSAFLIRKDSGTVSEYININRKQLLNIYVPLVNKEIATEITTQKQLEDKIDWFENAYDMRYKNECIIYNEKKNSFELNTDIASAIMEYDICRGGTYSLLIKLIHTNTDSATTEPNVELRIFSI